MWMHRMSLASHERSATARVAPPLCSGCAKLRALPSTGEALVLIVIRRLSAILLAGVAIAVWFTMKPQTEKLDVAEPTYSSQISAVMAEYEANNARTEGAPQQQVVNGWVARDLLEIMATQQQEALELQQQALKRPPAPNDERIPALLGLAVIGLAVGIATTPKLAVSETPAAAEWRGTASS